MKVIVYSSSHCQYCIDQKDFLIEKGVTFEERDIESSEEFRNEFININGVFTPTTILKDENEKIINKVIGFNKDKLNSLLLDFYIIEENGNLN